jgi:predicted ester cyclase
LLGIAPTGRTSAVTGITIQRLQGDRIVEGWTNWDLMGLLQQLGVAPELSQG